MLLFLNFLNQGYKKVRKNNNKKSKISIHRKIYELLKDDFQNGLHALEIKIAN